MPCQCSSYKTCTLLASLRFPAPARRGVGTRAGRGANRAPHTGKRWKAARHESLKLKVLKPPAGSKGGSPKPFDGSELTPVMSAMDCRIERTAYLLWAAAIAAWVRIRIMIRARARVRVRVRVRGRGRGRGRGRVGVMVPGCRRRARAASARGLRTSSEPPSRHGRAPRAA